LAFCVKKVPHSVEKDTHKMSLLTDFDAAVQRWTIVAAITFFFLFFVSAPYGRFHSKKWGPTIDGKIGWCVQEIASPIALSYFYFFAADAPFHFPKGTKPLGNGGDDLVLWWFVAHYAHRAIVWPMRRTLGKTNFPVVGESFFNRFFLRTRCVKAVTNEYPRFLSRSGS
jgi:hypothetical protein